MKHVIYGAYGAGNIGDDLLLQACLAKYDKVVAVIGLGPPLLRDCPTLLTVDELYRVNDLFSPDVTLVFGGGGQFWSKDHIDQMVILALRAKLGGSRVVLDSLGLQGAWFDGAAAGYLITIADEVSVRDHDSLAIARSVGVTREDIRVVPDLVSTLPVSKTSLNAPASRPVIGINLGDVRFYRDNGFKNHIGYLADKLIHSFQADYDFVYISHVQHISSPEHSCVLQAEELRMLTRNRLKIIPFPTYATDIFEIYRNLSAVVAIRYHAVIIGRMLDIPTVALVTEDRSKYRAVADEYGIPSVNIDGHGYDVAPRIADALRRVLDERSTAIAIKTEMTDLSVEGRKGVERKRSR